MIPAAFGQVVAPAQSVVLVKPQFEAGREHVGKGGIVRDPAAHQLAIDKVRACVESLGGASIEVADSPILGAKGIENSCSTPAFRKRKSPCSLTHAICQYFHPKQLH